MSAPKALLYGIIRYVLGCIMMAYAVTKILETQFIILPFNVWQQPLEEVWGGSLAWAFLSYSSWFAILLGFLELTPALLLLWRRTALLGTILMLPMTASVMLINFALGLWPQTQLLSTFLFVLNVLLLLFEKHKLNHILTALMGKKNALLKTLPETLVNVGIILFLCFLFSYPLLNYRSQKNALIGDWFNQHANEYSLIQQELNDSIIPHQPTKLYFMPYDEFVMVNDTIPFKPSEPNLKYKLDENLKTLALYQADTTKAATVFSYTTPGDTLLVMNNATEKFIYKKRVMNKRYRK